MIIKEVNELKKLVPVCLWLLRKKYIFLYWRFLYTYKRPTDSITFEWMKVIDITGLPTEFQYFVTEITLLLLKFSWNFGQNTEICLNFSVVFAKNTEICVKVCKNTDIIAICYWSELQEVGSPDIK